jgi:hypothetical protein
VSSRREPLECSAACADPRQCGAATGSRNSLSRLSLSSELPSLRKQALTGNEDTLSHVVRCSLFLFFCVSKKKNAENAHTGARDKGVLSLEACVSIFHSHTHRTPQQQGRGAMPALGASSLCSPLPARPQKARALTAAFVSFFSLPDPPFLLTATMGGNRGDADANGAAMAAARTEGARTRRVEARSAAEGGSQRERPRPSPCFSRDVARCNSRDPEALKLSFLPSPSRRASQQQAHRVVLIAAIGIAANLPRFPSPPLSHHRVRHRPHQHPLP